MISAKLEVPILHCTEQYNDRGYSEPYVWFAYFWADISTIGTSQPISVVVPYFPYLRDYFPGHVVNNQDISIPPQLNPFQVNVDDGGIGAVMLGMLIVLWERQDTPDEAMEAGYSAFRDAVQLQLNNFAQANGPVVPTEAQVSQIVSAIKGAVHDAIESKLNLWQELFDTQDDVIGYVKALFVGPQLQAGPVARSIPLNLPAIDEDVYEWRFDWNSYPLTETYEKVGHQHYEFIRPFLTLQQVDVDTCVAQEKGLSAAAAVLKALQTELAELQIQFATAPPQNRAAIAQMIKNIRSNQIPAAQKALDLARIALQSCRLQAGLGGIGGAVPTQAASMPRAQAG